jgi:hypothetical protein
MKLESVLALRDEVIDRYYNTVLGLAPEPGVRASAADIPRYTGQRLAIGARYRAPGDYAIAIRLESASGRGMSQAKQIVSALPDEREADVAIVKAYIPSRLQLTAAATKPANAPGGSRNRPLEIGISIGHGEGPPGTLGMFARQEDGATVALTNNHVIALANAARIADEIYQPGIPDQPGDAVNVIGVLGNYRKLRRSGSNEFDAAYCVLGEEQELAGQGNEIPNASGATDKGLSLDIPVSVDDLDKLVQQIGETATIAKHGRKTAYTTASITKVVIGINDVIVGVPSLGNCRFDNLIEIETVDQAHPFSDIGDSGSICYLEGARAPFGLIFAAGMTERNNEKTFVSYACALPEIFKAYKLSQL